MTSEYAYDGDGVRVSQQVNSTVTPYTWDRAAGLPLLLDDGDDAYLHAGGVLAQLDGSHDASYHLSDGLGSVRGLSDGSGALTGTADYELFGAVSGSTGASSVFGYTGEQHDVVTGSTYLRARYLSPTTGRFLSADTVQPNAPGTQGYNRYAYVANNPTTWTDPTGHQTDAQTFQPVLSRDWLPIGTAIGLRVWAAACAASPACWVAATLFIVVVLIIATCVIEIGGPCWTWVKHQAGSISLPDFAQPGRGGGNDGGNRGQRPEAKPPFEHPNWETIRQIGTKWGKKCWRVGDFIYALDSSLQHFEPHIEVWSDKGSRPYLGKVSARKGGKLDTSDKRSKQNRNAKKSCGVG